MIHARLAGLAARWMFGRGAGWAASARARRMAHLLGVAPHVDLEAAIKERVRNDLAETSAELLNDLKSGPPTTTNK